MQNIETLSLAFNQPLIVHADQVFVDSGIVWLTQTGYLRDVLLYAGQSYRSRPSGRVVIQALAEGTSVRLQSRPFGFRIRNLFASISDAVRSGFRSGLRQCAGRVGRTPIKAAPFN